jgi:DnaJ-class molecular chaperone
MSEPTRLAQCPRCEGYGTCMVSFLNDRRVRMRCPTCAGTGYVTVPVQTVRGEVVCPEPILTPDMVRVIGEAWFRKRRLGR